MNRRAIVALVLLLLLLALAVLLGPCVLTATPSAAPSETDGSSGEALDGSGSTG